MNSKDFEMISRMAISFLVKVRYGKHVQPAIVGSVQTGLEYTNTMPEKDQQQLHKTNDKHYLKFIQLMLVGFKNYDPII